VCSVFAFLYVGAACLVLDIAAIEDCMYSISLIKMNTNFNYPYDRITVDTKWLACWKNDAFEKNGKSLGYIALILGEFLNAFSKNRSCLMLAKPH